MSRFEDLVECRIEPTDDVRYVDVSVIASNTWIGEESRSFLEKNGIEVVDGRARIPRQVLVEIQRRSMDDD